VPPSHRAATPQRLATRAGDGVCRWTHFVARADDRPLLAGNLTTLCWRLRGMQLELD
jgi:hypothetical protein